jgi:hypothetical protein
MHDLRPTTLLTLPTAARVSRHPFELIQAMINAGHLEIEPPNDDSLEPRVQASNLLECLRDGGYAVSLEMARCSW